jgi:hypothetical protein
MGRNTFRNARRVAYLAAAVWAAALVIAVLTDDRGLRADYLVLSPDLPPQKVEELSCGTFDRQESEDRTTAAGTKVRLTLCFRAQQFDDGRMLVPFRSDGQIMEGDQFYSRPVQEYVERRKREFSLSKAEEETLDTRYWPSRRKLIWSAVQWLIGGWVALWLFTTAVGWVVRRMAGIPAGQDGWPRASRSRRHRYKTSQR